MFFSIICAYWFIGVVYGEWMKRKSGQQIVAVPD